MLPAGFVSYPIFPLSPCFPHISWAKLLLWDGISFLEQALLSFTAGVRVPLGIDACYLLFASVNWRWFFHSFALTQAQVHHSALPSLLTPTLPTSLPGMSPGQLEVVNWSVCPSAARRAWGSRGMGKWPSQEFFQRLFSFFLPTENPTKVIWVEGEKSSPLYLLGMPVEGNRTWWGAGLRSPQDRLLSLLSGLWQAAFTWRESELSLLCICLPQSQKIGDGGWRWGRDEAMWFLFPGVFCGLWATVDVSLCHVLPSQKWTCFRYNPPPPALCPSLRQVKVQRSLVELKFCWHSPISSQFL